jgi:hypothetical protein
VAPPKSLGWRDASQNFYDLVPVVRIDIAGNLGAFFHIAADDDVGRGRANVIGLFKTAIAAIEARDHLLAAVSARRFGIDQGLRLAPPFLAFAAVADAAQKMQCAENFRQSLQVVCFGPLTDIARHIRNVSPAVSLVSLSWLKALGTEHRSRNWSGEELDKRFRHLWHFGVSANPSGEECRAGELPRKRAKHFRSRHRHDL